jgi:hypothetical protein
VADDSSYLDHNSRIVGCNPYTFVRREVLRITKQQYEEMIADLQKGMTQLEPDGNYCAICTDSGHQAWECRFNPVVAFRQRDQLLSLVARIHDQLHEGMTI